LVAPPLPPPTPPPPPPLNDAMAGTEGRTEGGGMEYGSTGLLVALMIESGNLNWVDDQGILGTLGRLFALTKRKNANTNRK
jgi:hypothetical protein